MFVGLGQHFIRMVEACESIVSARILRVPLPDAVLIDLVQLQN